jgi:hypothetical protein
MSSEACLPGEVWHGRDGGQPHKRKVDKEVNP